MPDAKAVGLASLKPAKFVLNKFLLKGRFTFANECCAVKEIKLRFRGLVNLGKISYHSNSEELVPFPVKTGLTKSAF